MLEFIRIVNDDKQNWFFSEVKRMGIFYICIFLQILKALHTLPSFFLFFRVKKMFLWISQIFWNQYLPRGEKLLILKGENFQDF